MADFSRILFQDNFNRANSNTVGNGWAEVGEIDATTIAIVSNECRINVNQSGERYPYIRQSFVPDKQPIQIYVKFRPLQNTQRNFVFHLLHDTTTTQNGRGINVWFNWSNIYIRNNGTQLTSPAFSLTSNTTYYFWAEIIPNGSNYDVRVFVSTSSTKPGSPTTSVTNQAFTNVSTHTALQVDNASTTDGTQLFIDDFIYYDSKPTTGGNFFLQMI
jgi:hypothetical protein